MNKKRKKNLYNLAVSTSYILEGFLSQLNDLYLDEEIVNMDMFDGTDKKETSDESLDEIYDAVDSMKNAISHLKKFVGEHEII